MIYLDTHVVVWLYEKRLSIFPQAVIELIEQQANRRISPMVELELQYLYEIHKISVQPNIILEELYKTIDLHVCHIPSFSAVSKEALALSWTREPMDRMIVAHASLMQQSLITKDQTIHQHFPLAVWNKIVEPV